MNTRHISKTLYEMTQLLDDWDDDGGKAVSKDLASCVETFLTKMDAMARNWNRKVPDPHVSPGPEDTVDIHWKDKESELLVNVKNADGLCSFYGERPEDSHVIQGHGYIAAGLAGDFLRFILRMPIE